MTCPEAMRGWAPFPSNAPLRGGGGCRCRAAVGVGQTIWWGLDRRTVVPGAPPTPPPKLQMSGVLLLRGVVRCPLPSPDWNALVMAMWGHARTAEDATEAGAVVNDRRSLHTEVWEQVADIRQRYAHGLSLPPPPPSEAAPEAVGQADGGGRRGVGGGYCRLQMPLKPALGVRETVAGHRLGALQGGVGGCPPPPLSTASLAPLSPPRPQTTPRVRVPHAVTRRSSASTPASSNTSRNTIWTASTSIGRPSSLQSSGKVRPPPVCPCEGALRQCRGLGPRPLALHPDGPAALRTWACASACRGPLWPPASGQLAAP